VTFLRRPRFKAPLQFILADLLVFQFFAGLAYGGVTIIPLLQMISEVARIARRSYPFRSLRAPFVLPVGTRRCKLRRNYTHKFFG